MKKIFLSAYIFILLSSAASAQTVNWQALPAKAHILTLNMGWDYSFSWGLGYGYKLDTKFPVILKTEFSVPSGKDALDDFNVKLGANVRWIQRGSFAFSTEVDGVFRRYQNDYARLLNFGCYTAGVAGYYRPKWMAAGEFGFDKAIVTHFKHSDAMREMYPGIVTGWYEPATGGNFHYGIQAGYTLGRSDIMMKLGKVVEQDFETDPLVPYYFQISYNLKLQR